MAINLTPDQVDTLMQADAQIKILYQELDRAETAGLDVTDIRARLDAVEKLRSGIMNVYGPNSRRRRV